MLSRKRGIRGLALVVVLAGLAGPASALISHDDAAQPTVKPHDDVLGRHETRATVSVIGDSAWAWTDYVLTTRHQGSATGDSVYVGGTEYLVSYRWFFPDNPDLVILRLENTDGSLASLPNFTTWYSDTDEVGQEIVLGGYGLGTGTAGQQGAFYWYNWAAGDNTVERWGTNKIDSSLSRTVGAYTSDVLRIDFDREGEIIPGVPYGTEYEAAIAEHDSGGGWYINDGGEWKLAAIGAYSHEDGKSYYRPAGTDEGIRISSYTDTFDLYVSGKSNVVPGDANNDREVGLGDLGILAANFGNPGMAADGDFDRDGQVSLGDLGILAANYGYIAPWAPGETGSPFAPEGVVPEPATLSLLGLGAAMLLQRRR